jgi:hypothetical protein
MPQKGGKRKERRKGEKCSGLKSTILKLDCY